MKIFTISNIYYQFYKNILDLKEKSYKYFKIFSAHHLTIVITGNPIPLLGTMCLVVRHIFPKNKNMGEISQPISENIT